MSAAVERMRDEAVDLRDRAYPYRVQRELAAAFADYLDALAVDVEAEGTARQARERLPAKVPGTLDARVTYVHPNGAVSLAVYDEGGYLGGALLDREVIERITRPVGPLAAGDYVGLDVRVLSRSRPNGGTPQ